MELTAQRRAALLAYCRIDEPEEGQLELLESLCQAAAAYLSQAGVEEPAEDSPRRAQYDLALWALTLDYYDQRGAQEFQEQPRPNPAFRQLLNQLKLTEGGSPGDD